jgi:glycosyltransferase involved in cell wall biosynthesis
MRTKILYVITKSNWGGAQRYVFDLATNLDTQKFDVVVALGGNGQLVTELTKKSVRTIILGNLQRDISLTKEIRAIRELWQVIASEKPDVLHINSSKAGLLGALIGRVLRAPRIIFTAHGWAFNEDRAWWQKFAIKMMHGLTVFFSHQTIVVSNATKLQLNLPFVQNKMVVIYNGYTNTHLFSRTYARDFFIHYIPHLAKYAEDFWSVTIAELHPIKQHEVTIHALAQLVKAGIPVRHILIGDGEAQQSLKTLVSRLNLEDHVFFAGHIPDAARYLKAFDVFVLSSRSEALAYVIIEACAAGLPIIASNVGGIPEIIHHEREGHLFPQGNYELLAQYYAELYENKTLREELSHNALERASDFSFATMLTKTSELYMEE